MVEFKYRKEKPLDPETLSIRELGKYKGKSYRILQSTFRNFKRFGPVMGYTLLGTGIICMANYFDITNRIFGLDNKGGTMLDLKTRYTEDEMKYNREFQRMKYLSEPLKRKPGHRELEQSILNKGGKVPLEAPRDDVRKKSPHYKYY